MLRQTRGVLLCACLCILSASPASAAYATFENLWVYSINFINVDLSSSQLWSTDYGLRPPDAFPLDITKLNELQPGETYMTPLIPALSDTGFLFTGLGVAGDFGFSGISDVVPGHTTIVPASESNVIYALWPTGGPGPGCETCGTIPILRITFHAGAPPYSFNGFFSPVDNDPVVNQAKAGVAVPVKFSLNGAQGLNIFQAGFPASQPVACNTLAVLAPIEETAAPGQSGLHYDATLDEYTYVWKTDKRWANSCRQLVLRLTDGSFHIANFQFR